MSNLKQLTIDFWEEFGVYSQDPSQSTLIDENKFVSENLVYCESAIGTCTNSGTELYDFFLGSADIFDWTVDDIEFIAVAPSLGLKSLVMKFTENVIAFGECEISLTGRYALMFFEEILDENSNNDVNQYNNHLISQIHVTDSKEEKIIQLFDIVDTYTNFGECN